MKLIVFNGPEPKIIEDGHQKYLLYPAGCQIRVLAPEALQDLPEGQFIAADRFWEAIAKAFGIVCTDGKVFRGNNGYATHSAVMRLAGDLGFALYIDRTEPHGTEVGEN